METCSLQWWITLLAVWWMNQGLSDARRILPTGMHSANSRVWWSRNYVLRLFLGFGLSFIFPILCKQFREDPLLFQHDYCPCAQNELYKNALMSLGWKNSSGQSPDLDPLKTFGILITSQDFSSKISAWSDECFHLNGQKNPTLTLQNLEKGHLRRLEAVIAARRWWCGGGGSTY